MKLLIISPGTGSYYCGVCMRDNALARALIRRGHEAIMLPMYMPHTLDEESAAGDVPVFFGGVNTYLQEKFPFFRQSPAWLDKLLDHPTLLRWAANLGGMTGGSELGSLTYAMLAGEDGTVAKELRKLIAWIQDNARPDAILLSLALQAGLAGPLRRALDVPVIGFLQGEDVFLDTLSEPWRRLCWRTLSEQARHASPWVAPSAFYANYMGARMGLPEDELRVLPNGITLDGYPAQPKIAAEPDAVTLGYFAFQSRSKGLDVVIDAFLRYRSRPGARKVKLLVGGSVTDAQKSAVASWKAKVAEAGLGGDVVFHDNVSREHKLALLASMDLFTVAPNYPEAFGMYAVEALASGVPLVLPPTGALPEIVNASSGGVVLADGAPETIAAGWDRLIEDRAERTRLAALAHASARRLYGIDRLAESVEALVRGLVRRD